MSNRTKILYLVHISPPVGIGSHPVLLSLHEGRGVTKITLQDLSEWTGSIVTFSFGDAVAWFREQRVRLPREVIDLETAKQLVVGKRRADLRRPYPWQASQLLSPYILGRMTVDEARDLFDSRLRTSAVSDYKTMKCLRAALIAMPQVLTSIDAELKREGEYERFYSVEVPAYNVLLNSRHDGLRIDHRKCGEFIRVAEDHYIEAHRTLSLRENIDVDRALRDEDYLLAQLEINTSFLSRRSSRDIIRDLRDIEPRCKQLWEVISQRSSRNILLRTFSPLESQCYPSFDLIGTVTSRILVRDPMLQQLKRMYRSVFEAREDEEIVYIDYSQFEPTIMAALSSSKTLLELCREHDLYSLLAKELLGSTDNRRAAKFLFLAYSYGMGKGRLTTFAAELVKIDLARATAVIEQFLLIFSELEVWKENIFSQLESEGRLGTVLGNFRRRMRGGKLKNGERRWAISQVVQGTGALILKKVMIRLRGKLPDVRLLLPMHDALVLEVPKIGKVKTVDAIEKIFQDEFLEICPGVRPRVTVGPFS